ncbi:MAG TPA: ATP-binding cassette domain-containing protein [Candidatus Angelobacter sp.]|nr:ATP-binding cassette domain-containing protein [Candidatus Angelobacter sp.]
MKIEPSSILKTSHLSRSVRGRLLVDDISVEIRPGEVLAILGPSGSGKSSLLRLLNRLDEPTSGTVYLDDVDYRAIPPRELRRKVGMVTQRAVLFPGTVYHNVGFGPAQRGEEFSESKVADLLARVGLSGYSGRDVANLSGGEAQRISLARALANAPLVLLLDEPTSALDQEAKEGVESLINEIIRTERLTCVIVTHDIAQAKRMASRILVLQNGRAAKIGSVEEALNA